MGFSRAVESARGRGKKCPAIKSHDSILVPLLGRGVFTAGFAPARPCATISLVPPRVGKCYASVKLSFKPPTFPCPFQDALQFMKKLLQVQLAKSSAHAHLHLETRRKYSTFRCYRTTCVFLFLLIQFSHKLIPKIQSVVTR